MISKTPVLILAGGLGTRLSEETSLKPKPMVEIGGMPILLHIMRFYYKHGFNDFVICAGYRSWDIKKYFIDFKYRHQHLEIDHRAVLQPKEKIISSQFEQEKWRVRVLDTGEVAMTGARISRALDIIDPSQQFDNFAVTYGDGLSDVDLKEEFNFHVKHSRIGTVLAVRPIARFGELNLGENDIVESFSEKPQSHHGFINGGFFFFKRNFASYLSSNKELVLEQQPLVKLASDLQLKYFKHEGFWYPMDTLRDRNYLEELWLSGQAPWIQ